MKRAVKDYFSAYQIPRRFSIDLVDLDARYRLLQRNFHPDKFVNQSTQQQDVAEHASAELNQGYTTLNNSLARSQHLLALHEHEQGVALAETTSDSSLLMLQMERNEQLDEAETEDDLQHLQDEVNKDIADTESTLADIFNQEVVSQEQLPQAARTVQRLQFLTRLLASIDNTRNQRYP